MAATDSALRHRGATATAIIPGHPCDGVDRRRRRIKRIASQSIRTTTTKAATGAAKGKDRDEECARPVRRSLPSSCRGPPSSTVDLARTAEVTPCTMPAVPPPATMAAIHFIIGGRSAIVAADRMTPAIIATGAAMTSSRLSDTGNEVSPDLQNRGHAQHQHRGR